MSDSGPWAVALGNLRQRPCSVALAALIPLILPILLSRRSQLKYKTSDNRLVQLLTT